MMYQIFFTNNISYHIPFSSIRSIIIIIFLYQHNNYIIINVFTYIFFIYITFYNLIYSKENLLLFILVNFSNL